MFGSSNSRDYSSERDLAEAKRRQLLRQTNPELRQLESQLRLAYVEKERAAQRAEKRLAKLQQQLEDEASLERDREMLELLQAQEKEDERQQALNKIRYQKHLDLQVQEKQRERQVALEQFLEEKRLVDEVIEQVKKERREKLLQEIVKRETEKEQVQEFLEAQKAYAKLEKQKVEKENEKIRRFLVEKEAWTQQQEKIATERRQNKNEAILKLAEDIHRQQQEDLERDDIMHELYEGRQREHERRKELQELESVIRKRLLLRESNEIAAELKRKKKHEERLEEEEWRRKMLQHFAEQDRLEQLSNERRRRKQAQHRRDIELLLEERRAARERDRHAEALFWEEQKHREDELNRIIDEERAKLLQAHASKLIGFLPGGILQEKDLDYLDDDVRKSFRVRTPQRDPLHELEQLYISRLKGKSDK